MKATSRLKIVGKVWLAWVLFGMGFSNAAQAATSYNIANGPVVISRSGNYIIKGSSSVNRITVRAGVTANIVISNLTVISSRGTFSIASNSAVKLTLKGNNSLRSFRTGLQVNPGAQLFISAKSTGSLFAQGGTGAAIGGDSDANGYYGFDCGTVTINGGTVTAKAGGAGIGGGYGHFAGGGGGRITINGGTVTADGGSAGIGGGGAGGGDAGNGGKITINGGTVTAIGSQGSGIGGGGSGDGAGGEGGPITINGGTVTATGKFGAGIGGGSGEGAGDAGDGGTITINGGTVTATGEEGAGIGGGASGGTRGGDAGTITINGGTVTSTGEWGAGIGGGDGDGADEAGGGGTIAINGGMVTATGGRGAEGTTVSPALGPAANGPAGTLTIASDATIMAGANAAGATGVVAYQGEHFGNIWFPGRDAYEPDNTADAAKVIVNGQTQRRSIHAPGNTDWAKFIVKGRGAKKVRITTAGTSGDTQMWLYRANGTRVAYNDNGGVGNFSRIARSSLARGTYYVKIREYGNNGTIPAYTLRASWTPR